MVSFVCNACGNTVKKNQVEKHYQSQCRNCTVLSCIDCGVDFHGNSYVAHNSCVSEAQKYQGHLYQAKNKENKGENKQKEWIKQLQNATESAVDSKLKSLLQKISEYSNVPQKEKKFQNFCKNSLRIYDESTLSQLWNTFSGSSMQKPKIVQEKENPDDSNKSLNGIFNGAVQSEEVEKSSKEKRKNKRKLDNDNIFNGAVQSEEEVEKSSKEKRKNKRKLDNDNIEVEQKKKKKRVHNNNENIEENSKLSKIKEENESKPKKEKKRQKQTLDEVASDEDETIKKSTVKFQWHKVIKQVLKESQNKELSVKKLRKKVLSAYMEHGCDHNATTIVECRSMFDKKLKTYPKVKIVKDNVKLIK